MCYKKQINVNITNLDIKSLLYMNCNELVCRTMYNRNLVAIETYIYSCLVSFLIFENSLLIGSNALLVSLVF